MTEKRADNGGRQGARRGFPRALRVQRKSEFREVFDHGRSASDTHLIVYVRPRPDGGPARLGLVVGRKYGDSVGRNRFKRLVREAFRTRHPDLPEDHDLVVLPVGKAPAPSLAKISDSLCDVASTAARFFATRGPR